MPPSHPEPTRELVAASARPLLLSLLARGESYGYELIQRVREVSNGTVEWSEGMLYPVLHRLEREGLIKAQWRVSPETKRRRRYYRLSRKGRMALRQERATWMRVHATLTRAWNPRMA